MMKKLWNNIEIILITLSILIAMFTVGLMVGVYISSENIEKLLRYVLEWFGIIRLFGFILIMCNTKLTEKDVYVITFVWAICRICLTFENRR